MRYRVEAETDIPDRRCVLETIRGFCDHRASQLQVLYIIGGRRL